MTEFSDGIELEPRSVGKVGGRIYYAKWHCPGCGFMIGDASAEPGFVNDSYRRAQEHFGEHGLVPASSH